LEAIHVDGVLLLAVRHGRETFTHEMKIWRR
jgi:hypothetical protein